MSFAEVLTAAMKLPKEERYQLAALMLESQGEDEFLLEENAPEMAEEIERRLEDREGAVSWHQLRSESSDGR